MELGLAVVDGVEDGRVLGQEVAKRLGKGLGLGGGDLAEAAVVVLVEVPVDLADLVRLQLSDAGRAGAVVADAAAVHVGEKEAAGRL